jgi:glutamate-1-semialdehyde 2,1-aminomutase
MGVVPPEPGFLEGLRALCDRHEALLIFDEVMTGFRVALGGAQERYGITPDLTTLGKIIAGGAPAAAYGGREDLMRMVAPDGPVYQAGTLAGNPIAVAAGIACLRYLVEHPELYDTLEDMGGRLESRLTAALEAAGGGGCVQRVGSMLTVFLGPDVVRSWEDAAKLDRERFSRYYAAAFDAGIVLPPSPFEAMFLMEDHGPVIDEAAETLASAIGAA